MSIVNLLTCCAMRLPEFIKGVPVKRPFNHIVSAYTDMHQGAGDHDNQHDTNCQRRRDSESYYQGRVKIAVRKTELCIRVEGETANESLQRINGER